jgi:hypothetical protein
MNSVVPGVVGVVGILLLYFGYCIVGPEIDNVLGLLRARDLRMFLAHDQGGRPLGQILESGFGPCRWSSRHDNVIWATDIECRDATGRFLRWELSHLAPRDWLPPQAVYITPLNRAAAEAVPELLPVGVCAAHLTARGYRAGAVHDSGRSPGQTTPLGALLERTSLEGGPTGVGRT